MYFDSFSDFLAMGNHGVYVWLSYAAFLVLLVWLVVDAVRSRRIHMNKARKTWKRELMKQQAE